MKHVKVAESEHQQTIWQPDNDFMRRMLLDAILKNNPIPTAYRLAYVANFYVGPLIKNIEKSFKMTRPEWIVLFCLSQRAGLNAQQISSVTGRPKTSISAAVKQLQKKEMILRSTDIADARRQVLRITDTGRDVYNAILDSFVAREADMVAGLDRNERRAFVRLLDKIIANSSRWARPY